MNHVTGNLYLGRVFAKDLTKILFMKFIHRILAFVILLPLSACSQIDFNKINKEINKTVNTGTTNKPLSNDEIIRGLKEALNVGSNNAAGSASKLNGYFGN